MFLVGEAGIGKSRLAADAVSRARAANMVVLQGSCAEISQLVPFHPIIEALRSLAGRGPLPRSPELDPFRPTLRRLVSVWATGDRDLPGTAVTLLAEAVLRLVAMVGHNRGCLLLLEDLHDADRETLAVVEYLTEYLAGSGAMLLATSRAAPRTAPPAPAEVLLLARLGRAEVTVLAAACLDIVPAALSESTADLVWRHSAGIPLLVEELTADGIGTVSEVGEVGGVGTVGEVGDGVPDRDRVRAILARAVPGRAGRLADPHQAVLRAAAVLGRPFPRAVLDLLLGLDEDALRDLVSGLVGSGWLVPDERGQDWYALTHTLVAEALRSAIPSNDRIMLSRRAAASLAAVHPDLPGEWCVLAANLRLAAGDLIDAARLLAEAGRRALAEGAAESAISLLDRADTVVSPTGDQVARDDIREALLYALVQTNNVERALPLADELTGERSYLGVSRRVAIRVRMARCASHNWRWDIAAEQVGRARAILGPRPSTSDAAAIDLVAARLALDMPGPHRIAEAQSLARSAIAAAQRVPQPAVDCEGWYVLAVAARTRDLTESTACFERIWATAQTHHLPLWKVHGRGGSAMNTWLAEGEVQPIAKASREALRAGLIEAASGLDALRAMHAVLCGDFAIAADLLDAQLRAARRLRFARTERFLLMTHAVAAAHQGRRPEMEAALAEFRARGGDKSRQRPVAAGLASAFCALLREDRERATRELELVVASQNARPTSLYLAGPHGLYPLLLSLAEGSTAMFAELSSAAGAKMRWNRQFVEFGHAVLLGRSGRTREAEAAVAKALRAANRYPVARMLGLRLIAESAHADGWGQPVTWLRQAEGFFHRAYVPAVAGACRAALRQLGAPVPQRRTGTARVPQPLRELGITLREYEVFELLLLRLGNKEIAGRLHISPRTVEKHVAGLLAKTGSTNRASLIAYASARQGRG